MQLLPTAKVREQVKNERETEVFRKLRVAKAQAKEEKELHEIVVNFDPQKKKIKKEFDDFRADIEKKKSTILGEILVLEKRRDTAMEPFYELKFQALEAMDKAKEYEDAIKKMAKTVNTERIALTTLRTSLEEKAELLSKKEHILGTTEIGLIEREASITKDEKELYKDKESFEAYRANTENELAQKDRDLKEREATVEGKLAVVDERERKLADERKHIESQQATLKLAFDEARKKGIL